jgi:hypothetical protein
MGKLTGSSESKELNLICDALGKYNFKGLRLSHANT